jgi:hypothetical protein
VAVRAAEVQPAAVATGVDLADLAGPPAGWVRGVRRAVGVEAGADPVEVLVADQEGVMLRLGDGRGREV